MAKVRELKSVGACSSILEKNKISIIPDSKGEDKFGVEFVCNLDPLIAKSGGFLEIYFRVNPDVIRVNCLDDTPIEVKLKNSPVKIILPRRTVGFDPRAIRISLTWNQSDGEPIIFNAATTISQNKINPVLWNYGRGMRKNKYPELVSHSLNIDGISYIPRSFFEVSTGLCFRDYNDESIHVDKMGPFSFSEIAHTALDEPFMNYDKTEVGNWEGVKRDSQGIPIYTNLDGTKGINPRLIFVDILSLVSRNYGDEKLSPNELDLLEKELDLMIEMQNRGGLWDSPFSITRQDVLIEPNWNSAWIQGLGASAFIRASVMLGNQTLEKIGEDAIQGLIENPSLSSTFFDCRIFQEISKGPAFSPLNSHLVAIMGIADLAQANGSAQWTGILNEAIDDLIRLLPLYDLGISSAYDLSHYHLNQAPCVARPQYHATHVSNLIWLSKRVSSEKLENVASRWKTYFTRIPYSRNN